MNSKPRAARLFVGFVLAAGLALLAVGLPQAHFDQPVLFTCLLVLSAAAAGLKVTLPLTTSQSTLSVSYAVDFAALLLIGPHETMLVAAASAFSQCQLNTKTRSAVYRTLFSMAALIITVQGAGLAYAWLGGLHAEPSFTAMARPLVGAATVYFMLNTGLVAMAIALESSESMFVTWQRNFLWSAPSYFAGAACAGAAVLIGHHLDYWLMPLGFAPLYLTYRTYKVYMGRIEDEQRHATETSELHLATIEALARAIDAKDRTTQSHIRRVQCYAAGLARAAGLSKKEIQGVKTGALLHDIGKLAIPEHILSKPGPLTEEEFRKVRIHPQVGAEIIAGVPFPYPVAPMILSHHERWDGKGYPQGLSGEGIPVGARILTIVDYYDAITTDRPYHKAISHESALTLLQHEAGRALDPTLVKIFVDIIPELRADQARLEPAGLVIAESAPGAPGTTAKGLVPAGRATAYENIALAHREIYALYEIAQTLGTSLSVADTMTLVSSKLSNVIPWTGCALFLQDPDGETLTCRFASGEGAAPLLNTRLRMGHGLCGWVARTGRTLVNADPQVTFEALDIKFEAGPRAAIVCPLTYNDSFIGSLALYHADADRYTEDHRRLIERIAEQAGPVLHNAIVFEQTQEESLTDPLTSLPNRRSLFTYLSRELSRAGRLRNETAVIILDIDGFKAINDTYGHSFGDETLRQVAAALQTSLRPYDLSVRYGGDEFVVVLPECSASFGEVKRRELQGRIESLEIPLPLAGKTIRLGASAGLAVYPRDGATAEDLLANADAHMYKDKAARRSMTTLQALHGADDLVGTPSRLVRRSIAPGISLPSIPS